MALEKMISPYALITDAYACLMLPMPLISAIRYCRASRVTAFTRRYATPSRRRYAYRHASALSLRLLFPLELNMPYEDERVKRRAITLRWYHAAAGVTIL